MIHDKTRVDAIRSRIKSQVELAESLKAKIVKGDDERRWLDMIRMQTEDVESLYLSKLDREDRTPAQEAQWLLYAEQMLAIHVPKLKQMEEQFKKYGDKIEFAGG
jgi:hypothetical protein